MGQRFYDVGFMVRFISCGVLGISIFVCKSDVYAQRSRPTTRPSMIDPVSTPTSSPSSKPVASKTKGKQKSIERLKHRTAYPTTYPTTQKVIEVIAIEPKKKQRSEQEEDASRAYEEEVVVISASKTPQNVIEAPSIITAISRRDLIREGYRTIGEVLRHTVGFGINDNGHWPDTGVRGINGRTTYGDKIQFLIDGHNMSWRQFNRNFHNPTWVSIEDIEHIEVIRGPGAAIWGSNALTGVVNIVTRDWKKIDGAEISYGADHRYASQFVSARAGGKVGSFHLFAAASYYAEDNDSILAPYREFLVLSGEEIRLKGDREVGVSVRFKVGFKDFTFSLHKSRYDTNAPLSTLSVIGGDDSRFITDRHIVRLDYEKMIFAGFETKLRLSYDDYRFADGTVFESFLVDSGRSIKKMAAVDRRWEAKGEISWMPTLRLSIVGGVEFEYLDLIRWHFPEVWADAGLTLDSVKFTNFHLGSFIQAQYSPLKRFNLTAGMRFDWDERYGAIATPRAGLVYQFENGIYLKSLFGMAFKGPSFHDLYYFRKNAFYGNPDLKPEQSYTGEAQVGFRIAKRCHLRLTGFYTRINDLIAYQAIDAEDLVSQSSFPSSQRPDPNTRLSQKKNISAATTKGVELEGRFNPLKKISLRVQGTYRLPRDENGQRLFYSSEWSFGGSITWLMKKGITLTLRGLALGDKLVPARGLSQPGFAEYNVENDPTLTTPAYFLTTVIFYAELYRSLSLHVKLDNLTNTDYWDAGRDVLYPQKRFQGMIWLNAKL